MAPIGCGNGITPGGGMPPPLPAAVPPFMWDADAEDADITPGSGGGMLMPGVNLCPAAAWCTMPTTPGSGIGDAERDMLDDAEGTPPVVVPLPLFARADKPPTPVRPEPMPPRLPKLDIGWGCTMSLGYGMPHMVTEPRTPGGTIAYETVVNAGVTVFDGGSGGVGGFDW